MKSNMRISFAVLLMASVLTACVTPVQQSIQSYRAVKDQIAIGDSKEDVLLLIEPLVSGLKDDDTKAPEIYVKDGKKTEVYFARSTEERDGLTTDDEFTPYVFEDGKLVAIGWTYLGGPKTQAQTTRSVGGPSIFLRYDVGINRRWSYK